MTRPAARRPATGRAAPVRTGGGAGRPRPGAGRARPAPAPEPGRERAGPRPAAAPRPKPVRYRRRRAVAALLSLLVLLVGVGLGVRVLLYDSGLADVEGVRVTGLAAVPEPDVVAAAAVAPGGPLAAVDTTGVARRVVALPGVASVEVSRQWPHTVSIEVTERVPVALATTPQGLWVVDTTGVAYRPAGPAEQQLPQLGSTTVGPDDPGTRAALAVLAALPHAVRAQVRTVGVTDGTQVVLGLADEREVRWGGADRSAEKITVLGPLLTQPGTVYDVSSPELPTVRR